MRIIRASSSPRRKAILDQLGLFCEIKTSPVPEALTDRVSPEIVVCRNALTKLEAVSAEVFTPEVLIISADTAVSLDNRIMGKPENPFAAKEMLGYLSGRTHTVLSGVSVRVGPHGPIKTGYEVTAVTLRKLTTEEINRYVDTCEPFDKAGGYGIQGLGAFLVQSISGCYFNVVGLPIVRLAELSGALGVDLFAMASQKWKQGSWSFSS